MNYKYNVGDKVRVRNDLVFDSYNGTCVTYDMLKYRGKEMEIKEQVRHSGNAAYHFCGDKDNWFWTEDMIEPVSYRPTDTIIITTDGNETRAYHKKGGKIISQSKCIRNKADEHDLQFASKLCVERLFEERNSAKTYYTGRVYICVHEPRWIPVTLPDAHIFEVKDGYFSGFSDHEILKTKRFSSFEELAEYFDVAALVLEVKGEVKA